MDLVSASSEKLERLPESYPSSSNQEDRVWLEAITEKAARGIPEAQFALGQYHFSNGRYQEALGWFEKAATGEGGSSQAKYQLGVMYYDGLGVPEDQAKGFSYMLDVAQSKRKKDSNIVPSAQYNVGRAYFMGFGTSQSDSEAERWWTLSAECGSDPGSIRAQNTLGLFYAREESLNLDKSYAWHTAAAGSGHKESMAALGLFHLDGQGSNKDSENGLAWLKKSSASGCIHGTGLLALQYYTRKLFSKAAETAFKVSELEEAISGTTDESQQATAPDAAEKATGSNAIALDATLSPLDRKGVALGCFVLARCLQLGQAVARNERKALDYYNKAIRFDKRVVAELHDKLTHGQL